MDSLVDTITKFNKRKIAIIGDAMLDVYIHGTVERIAREAPIPIVETYKTVETAGGAANTAVNISSLGASSYLISVIGQDEEGLKLKQVLKTKKVKTRQIIYTPERRTLAKKRIVADGQVLLRFDAGDIQPISGTIEKKIIKKLENFYKNIDALIISDYGYGLITDNIRKSIERLQKIYKKILVIDAKNLQRYKINGTTLIKPNFTEAVSFVGDKGGSAAKSRKQFIRQNGEYIRESTHAKIAAITADKNGSFVFTGNEKPYETYTTPTKNANAVGAGDTYISAFTLALTNNSPIKTAADLASIAAEIVVKKTGTTSCTQKNLLTKVMEKQYRHFEKIIDNRYFLKEMVDYYRRQRKRIVFTNGCFDILHTGHVTYLNKARRLGDILIVGLNSDSSVKRLKGPERPINNEKDRANVLASLECISHLIIFPENTPVNILKIVKPDIFVKGGDYSRDTLPETPVVEKFGGKIFIIPLVHNKSTTNIIKKIRGVDDESIAQPNAHKTFTGLEV